MSLARRGQAKRIRRACNQTPALYSVDDFKHEYRRLLYEALPELSDEKRKRELVEAQHAVLNNILPDPIAKAFFDDIKKPNGEYLLPEENMRYYNNAIILNSMRRAWEKSYSLHSKSGHLMMPVGEYWKGMSEAMAPVCEKYINSLQWNPRRLQEQAAKYYFKGEGGSHDYGALLKFGRYGNINRVKITPQVGKVLLSIYGTKEKLFVSEVQMMYNEFLLGARDIVNHETGEIFDRKSFYKNGEPQPLSEAAVWQWLNKPKNRRLVDMRRNDRHYNQQKHTPYVERESPHFSLSKISMDDRDLCRKTLKGEWVHAYYAYDVASGCVIGASYSLKKDTELVMECFRNMFQNLRSLELNTPAECEVENHLMKELSDRLHATFLHVTFCAPENSQEKRSEQLNKQKKYYGETSERRQGMAHGRHYAKHEAYLSTRKKIFDDTNENFKQDLPPADFNFIVAEDRAQTELYNNTIHPNKEQYPHMTRMQVLTSRQFTQLAPLNWRILSKEWGYEQSTSLKRARSATVQYREWWLSSPMVIDRFKPNNYECLAYYLPDLQGNIESIYLYQDGKYIDECRALGKFQEAIVERTERDVHIMHKQLGYKKQYYEMLNREKAEKLEKLTVIPAERTDKALREKTDVETLPATNITGCLDGTSAGDCYEYDLEYYAASAVADM
jgi:hypothetical protein